MVEEASKDREFSSGAQADFRKFWLVKAELGLHIWFFGIKNHVFLLQIFNHVCTIHIIRVYFLIEFTTFIQLLC